MVEGSVRRPLPDEEATQVPTFGDIHRASSARHGAGAPLQGRQGAGAVRGLHRFGLVLALVGCQGPRNAEDGRPSDTPELGPQLGPSLPLQSDTGDDPDIVDSGDTQAVSTTWRRVGVSDNAGVEYGYELVEYELREDAPDPYPPLFEDQPRFWLLKPTDADTRPRPVMVLYHGGGFGDDSSGSFPNCTQEDIERLMGSHLYRATPVKMAAYEAGWVMVIPRYEWCDGGMGLGADDPADPERHWGHVHSHRVLDFVMSGQADFEPSGELYGWGTSMGGTTAAVTAAGYPGFTGLVLDSAPSSLLLYWSLRRHPDDRTNTEHVLGGAPYAEGGVETEHWARFASVSAPEMVEEGTLRVPTFVAWNNRDGHSDPRYHQVLTSSLAGLPADEALRWSSYDFNRNYPEGYHHVQTRTAQPPAGLAPYAAFRFLEGNQLFWREAEHGCADTLASACSVGGTIEYPENDKAMSFSGSAGLRYSGNQPAGTLWCDLLPESIEPGQVDQLVFGLLAGDCGGLEDDEPVAEVTYYEAGEPVNSATFVVSDFESGGAEDMTLDQYKKTWIEIVPEEPGSGHVCLEVTGAASLWLDAVVHVVQ